MAPKLYFLFCRIVSLADKGSSYHFIVLSGAMVTHCAEPAVEC